MRPNDDYTAGRSPPPHPHLCLLSPHFELSHCFTNLAALGRASNAQPSLRTTVLGVLPALYHFSLHVRAECS